MMWWCGNWGLCNEGNKLYYLRDEDDVQRDEVDELL